MLAMLRRYCTYFTREYALERDENAMRPLTAVLGAFTAGEALGTTLDEIGPDPPKISNRSPV